jgi:hypothetical protein
LLVFVLLAAFAASRTCAGQGREISQDEAVAIATDAASFRPCSETGCVVVRAVQRGIPTRLTWIVGLAENLDDEGRPTRFQNFLIDAETGEITGP